MGPWFGWIGGWAIAMTGVLVIGSLADVGVSFSLRTFGADAAADNAWIRMPLAIVLILLLTYVCILGTDVSAKLQNALIIAQVVSLLVFAAVAITRAVTDNSPLDPIDPSLGVAQPVRRRRQRPDHRPCCSASSPTGAGSRRSTSARRPATATATPGRAALWSTVVLLVTYVAVAVAVVAFAGTQWLTDNAGDEEFVFACLADLAMGDWGWVVLASVATSAIASTQTTIIPASRTGLSMARRHALPARLGRIHPRHRTPDVSTWTVAAIAIAWYVGIYQVSANALFDSLTALALLIAFYYALTGVACAVYHRKHLLESPKNLLLIGVGPLVGAAHAGLAAGAVGARHGRPGELLQRRLLARRRTAAGHRRRDPPGRHPVHAVLAGQGQPLLAGARGPARPRRGARPQGRRGAGDDGLGG